MWRLAEKHSVSLPYASVEEIEAAYNFKDLQSFLDLYYAGAGVLRDEDDFFILMWEYLTRCAEENIVHTEIMFDPQTHTERGIGFDVFMPGFLRAIQKAETEYGISSYLIMSFLRHLPESEAYQTLEAAKPYYQHIKAVGLDSSELGHPPSKFERVFKKARSLGFKIVAHAGEEGPASYIWEAIELLDVDRIDHGVRCQEDQALMAYLKEKQIPLTLCPLSNLKLCVIDDMKEHNIVQLLDAGLLVTVNSDDPTYFGGFLNENFEALHTALNIDESTIRALAANSFRASFLPAERKKALIEQVEIAI
jgi:adenosine deaminase